MQLRLGIRREDVDTAVGCRELDVGHVQVLVFLSPCILVGFLCVGEKAIGHWRSLNSSGCFRRKTSVTSLPSATNRVAACDGHFIDDRVVERSGAALLVSMAICFAQSLTDLRGTRFLGGLATEMDGPEVAGLHQFRELGEGAELREVEIFRDELRQRRDDRFLVAEHFFPGMALDGWAGQFTNLDDLFPLLLGVVVFGEGAAAAHAVELETLPARRRAAGKDAEQIDLLAPVGRGPGRRGRRSRHGGWRRPVSSMPPGGLHGDILEVGTRGCTSNRASASSVVQAFLFAWGSAGFSALSAAAASLGRGPGPVPAGRARRVGPDGLGSA